MNEDQNRKLDEFLRLNAPAVPPAPNNQKELIWNQLARAQTPWWSGWIPQIKIVLPVATALALLLVVVHERKASRDREIERVLASALVFQIEEAEESPF